MSAVAVWVEISEGRLKKPTLEVLTAARQWADSENLPVVAIALGADFPPNLTASLGEYGADRVIRLKGPQLEPLVNSAYARALAQLMRERQFSYLLLPQTYDGRAIAPFVAVWADGALLSGITQPPQREGSTLRARRIAYSNKAIEWIATDHLPVIATLKSNSIVPAKNPRVPTEEELAYTPLPEDLRLKSVGIEKVATDKVPLTEAEIVVSAGRGLKGPENWGMIEELAKALGAATACSKPVADVGWRPHHEHVGQTGIQISPNLYIAIGISGAIQHLAGVASSKNIVVINNDPEAPFFKVADYGIVGDAFQVVPQLTEAIRKYKEQHAH
ncbi:MAG: electron transfer flavoprotein subunit alpha/FixB family protein [Bacteroidia bacterium]|nr:electron transfer flavoprotein subunit alpha/FixB family protein [Bacteroidia bacterium]MDW8088830.1 electron transfer flavoprotein subunit alpha/FixB family protein [Bacteroidia bacterium]